MKNWQLPKRIDVIAFDLSLAVLIGLLLAALAGVYADPLGRWTGLLDYPDPVGGRKRHSTVTPLLGGTAVLVPVLLVTLGTAALLWAEWPSQGRSLFAMFSAVLGMYMLGLLDDRFELTPRLRLLLSTLVLGIAVFSVHEFELTFLVFSFAQSPILIDQLTALFTLTCMVGLVNAVNMADGKNGIVIGMSLIWTTALIYYAPAYLLPVLVCLFAALLVALVFNLSGKFFLGDGGSYGLATLVGLLAIKVYNLQFAQLSADQIVLWFLVPVADCLRVMSLRMVRGRSPFRGDRDHLHHYLGMMMSWPLGLAVYWLLVAVPIALSVFWPSYTPAFILVQATAYMGILAGAALLQRSGQSRIAA